jgi:hypothetical protein
VTARKVPFGELLISVPPRWQSEARSEGFVSWPEGRDAAVTVSSYARIAPDTPTKGEVYEQSLRFARQLGWAAPTEIDFECDERGGVSAFFGATISDSVSNALRTWGVRVLLCTRRLIIASYNVAESDRSECERDLVAVIRSVREADN